MYTELQFIDCSKHALQTACEKEQKTLSTTQIMLIIANSCSCSVKDEKRNCMTYNQIESRSRVHVPIFYHFMHEYTQRWCAHRSVYLHLIIA